jgi:hypothetical protein
MKLAISEAVANGHFSRLSESIKRSKAPVSSFDAAASCAVVWALLSAVSARLLVTPKTLSSERKYVLAVATLMRFEADGTLAPLLFFATTAKVYEEPGFKPFTTHDVDFVVQDFADGFDVTTYPRIGVAPVEAGLDHFTLIAVAMPLACTARGADGLPVAAPADDATSPVATSDTNAAA